MVEAGTDLQRSAADDTQQVPVTDGFRLVIEALKLKGIENVFGFPGLPVTVRNLRRSAWSALSYS